MQDYQISGETIALMTIALRKGVVFKIDDDGDVAVSIPPDCRECAMLVGKLYDRHHDEVAHLVVQAEALSLKAGRA